jgi:hypothetical protein
VSLFTNTARLCQVACLVAAFSVAATRYTAAQLLIDNFSTGAYQKTLITGEDSNTQPGKMWGHSRWTVYGSCPNSNCSGGGVGDNPFGQPNSFEIKSGSSPSHGALIFNSGYKTYPYLALKYGYGKAMKEDLASTYDRIRVHFDGANQSINFNIQVFSNNGSLHSEIGCNLQSPGGFMTPFSADFPFKYFTPGTSTGGADFSGINYMIFELGESEGPNMEADYAVTSIKAIPKSDPPSRNYLHRPRPVA